MKLLGDLLRLATKYLADRQDPHARRHAEELLSWTLNLPRLDLYLQFDRPLVEEEVAAYRKLIQQKSTGKPLEYIIGQVEFGGCQLKISPDVLIPRPETEILLSHIIEHLNGVPDRLEVWDLCCGSGCLGLSIQRQFPHFSVTMADFSEKAVEVARENNRAAGLCAEVVLGDLLAPFKDKKADVVVCNPPYISKKEYDSLDRSVRDFEPEMALLGGVTGLEFYERLSRELPQHLRAGSKVFFEIGFCQGRDVAELFQAPCWTEKILKKDWAGHDRFFFLEFESLSLYSL